jgi:hypothetical protein
VSLAAPSTGGGLRLIRLADTGTAVKAGDVVMEFDPAAAVALEQARTSWPRPNRTSSRQAQMRPGARDEVGLLTPATPCAAGNSTRGRRNACSANDYKRLLTLEGQAG